MSMGKITNREIAQVLKEIALYKELAGENPFKVRAFEQAARSVEINPGAVTILAEQGKLQEIRGIGKSVEEVILDIINTGRSSVLEEIRSSFPKTIHELFRIPGMGPKKVKAVWEKLDISTIGELEYACRENRLITLEGFGKKSQEKILESIEVVKRYREKHLISEVLDNAREIIAELSAHDIFNEVKIAGSLRRGKSTFKDIDILLVSDDELDKTVVKDLLLSLTDKESDTDGIISAGPTKVSIRRSGLQIDFRIVESGSYPSALQHFTGSKEHNTILRSRAKRMGLKMNEYGLFKDEKKLQVSSEEDLYKSIGLSFIPPEIREGEEEVEASIQGKLPKLVEKQDIQGMIHVHTNYSDGTNSIEELSEECIKQGYTYLCISDHSRSAFYAHGLSIESLLSQIEDVKRLNKRLSLFRIFCGIESDILSDGSLDYPDEVLAKLDFVIGSIHSKLSMKTEEATERLLKAIKNPYLSMLGHLSGRLLLSRQGYQPDEERILDALSDQKVILEHNCNPHRLDPDWRFLKRAKDRGILISINTDAHSVEGYRDMEYGLIMARKGWIEKEGLLNCKTGEEIHEFFTGRKKEKGIRDI